MRKVIPMIEDCLIPQECKNICDGGPRAKKFPNILKFKFIK